MKTKMKQKRKFRTWHVILGIGAAIAGLMMVVFLATGPSRAEVKNLTFSNIDFDKLHDGIYIGHYKGVKDSSRDTSVEVTISSGKIMKINAVGGALAGEKQENEINNGKSLNDLFDSIIERETLQVDVISGATLTSKSYLKAVEDALNKAQSE